MGGNGPVAGVGKPVGGDVASYFGSGKGCRSRGGKVVAGTSSRIESRCVGSEMSETEVASRIGTGAEGADGARGAVGGIAATGGVTSQTWRRAPAARCWRLEPMLIPAAGGSGPDTPIAKSSSSSVARARRLASRVISGFRPLSS